ncbi:TrmH family RNA methyltransferase [Acidisarcina polymorpha]|uniref:TrmH family RNA methyltransferase n=1 Tax=Acidisarcina polymorpha TaxID=2211140 RepID=UPI0023AB37A5|nr:TrmH family RNA methyltransferase [Acidisarcina polymorpha]
MLSEDALDRLCVVLVRARDPNNIGAAARAMYDFGFHRLRLVNEYRVPLERAKCVSGPGRGRGVRIGRRGGRGL